MELAEPKLLDVPTLLESSQPVQQRNWLGRSAFLFFLLILGSSIFSAQSPASRVILQLFSSLTMLGVFTAMAVLFWRTVQRHREEQTRLQAIDELIQLRRWSEATGILQELLSQPTRSPQNRVQALMYLTTVLGRYHRYEDAILVQNYLLDEIPLDPGLAYGVRLGRAMAMLHEDHLFDADRAINELRRISGEHESAGLALVEIYRDVKTGHPAEAVEMFESKLTILREQLGHRVADAYALTARAYDLLGREADARQAYERATLLSPPSELHRRYAELASLSEKYPMAPAPAGAQ